MGKQSKPAAKKNKKAALAVRKPENSALRGPRNKREKLASTVAALSVAHPRTRKLLDHLGVVSGGAMVVWSAAFATQIGELSLPYFIPLVLVAAYNTAMQLLPSVSKHAALALESVEQILREIRAGITLRPVDDWQDWTFDDWAESTSDLAAMVERLADAVLEVDARPGVSCNIMVNLAWTADTVNDLEVLAKKIDPREGNVVFPFQQEVEGVAQGDVPVSVAVLVGRGTEAARAGYPWIALRVPKSPKAALPGAPHAIHSLRTTKDYEPIYQYIPRPRSNLPAMYNKGVTGAAQDAFRGYMEQYRDDIGSFLSFGLSWNGEAVGVLNIGCPSEGFLDDDHLAERLLSHLVNPYLEIAAAHAHIFRISMARWRTQ